jgi:hypothetical protein
MFFFIWGGGVLVGGGIFGGGGLVGGGGGGGGITVIWVPNRWADESQAHFFTFICEALTPCCKTGKDDHAVTRSNNKFRHPDRISRTKLSMEKKKFPSCGPEFSAEFSVEFSAPEGNAAIMDVLAMFPTTQKSVVVFIYLCSMINTLPRLA